MEELVIATNNPHKVKEINAILGEKFLCRSLKELNVEVEIEEDGKTFYDNALKKARTVAEITGKVCLADDSGLEVNALNGEPGVYSARYAGIEQNDENNNLKLLRELKNKSDRSARFVSIIVVYFPNGNILSAEGEVKGTIINEKRGENGFGYDPLFYSDELKKTFAEATAEEKNSISHRARALARMAKLLTKTEVDL